MHVSYFSYQTKSRLVLKDARKSLIFLTTLVVVEVPPLAWAGLVVVVEVLVLLLHWAYWVLPFGLPLQALRSLTIKVRFYVDH